jgi:hypothetical protein
MTAPPVYSFTWLCEAMQTRKVVTILLCSGRQATGMVNSISVEDGSGRNWLVKMSCDDHPFFVRAE